MKAVLEFPRPQTVTDVRSFLGLCGYYRKFVKDYAKVSGPLVELTTKQDGEKPSGSKKVMWGPAAEKAFERLKEILTSEPVLMMPDFDKHFYVQTDASGEAMGAVLSQIVDGQEHPCHYISKRLNSAQRNYSTTEREALAIHWAVMKFETYLKGRRFTLITDHQPLIYLKKTPSVNRRVAKWQLQLDEFDFKVKYRPGRKNGNADALSRPASTGKEVYYLTPAGRKLCLEHFPAAKFPKLPPWK